MNDLAFPPLLEAGLWCVVQVTLLSSIALLLLWPLAWLKRPLGGGPALSAIAMAGVLTLLSFAPLPRWWNAWSKLARNVSLAAKNENVAEIAPANAEAEPSSSPALNKTAQTAEIDWLGVLQKAVANAEAPLPARSIWDWRIVAAGASLGLGVLSLAASLLSLSRLRRGSRPIEDKELGEQIDILRAQAGNTRPISLRESSLIGGPATFGHFSPLILLPPSWKTWTPTQREAVLAHEIAHIKRGDFLSHLFSQCCLALHFYHPLMHWLVGRLRLDQELAADALAANWIGSRDRYLRALAEVALSLPPRGSSLAARAFVPSRGAWVRRIEMLKSMRSAAARRRGGPFVWLFLMGLVAAAVSTIRGPQGLSMAQEPIAAAPASKQEVVKLVTKYVPKDADFIVALRPHEASQTPVGKIAIDLLPERFKRSPGGTLRIEEIEQVVIGGKIEPSPTETSKTLVVLLRSTQPGKLASLFPPEKKKVGGAAGIDLFEVDPTLAWGAIDDRTVLLGSPSSLTRLLISGGGSPLTSSTAWTGHAEAAGTPAVAIVRSEAVRFFFKMQPSGTPDDAMIAVASPIWEDSQIVSAAFFAADRVGIHYQSEQADGEASQRIVGTWNSLTTIGKNLLRSKLQKSDSATPAQLHFFEIAKDLLDSASFSSEDKQVTGKLSIPADEKFAAALSALITSARVEAAKAESQNNLKQIGIALHNYHDTYGRFPPAVVLGPDGKTPHSWRVALLPFIEQNALYMQYKFDEPWDSENNKKVLAQIPRTYQDPSERGKSTSASYFAIAGEHTILNSTAKGSQLATIVDGTSNTLMVVDAKREIPWTKPEDLSVDTPAAALGYEKDAFQALFGDGSVRTIPKTIDAAMLKWLFLRDDGNVVTIP